MERELTIVFFCLVAWLSLSTSEETRIPSLRFTHEPRHLTFLNTISSKIPCRAVGYPPPKITWITEFGDTVDDIKDTRLVLSDGTLFFPAFTPILFTPTVHRARYRCKASSSVGILLSREIAVHAVVDLRYSPRVFHQSAIQGGSAVFHCFVPFEIQPYVTTVSWSILSRSTSTKRIVVAGSSVERFHALTYGPLIIKEVVINDEDLEFSCTTENRLNNVSLTSSRARLFVQEPSPLPAKTMLFPQDQSVKVGDKAVLACIAVGYPLPVYTWKKDDKKIETETRISQLSEGAFVISNVKLEDSGIYECAITSPSINTRQRMRLTVRVPLKVLKGPVSQTLQVGKSVNFDCQIAGSPSPQVQWLKDGKVLRENGRVSVSKDSLTIFAIGPDDEGIYECLVKNAFEEIQASARLVLGASRPEITSEPRSQIVQVESIVRLMCTVSGSPLPSICWLVDDRLIKNDGIKYSVLETVDGSGSLTSVLTVKGILVEDSGIYSCQAENVVDRVYKSAQIFVRGPPKITGLPTSKTVVAGESLVLVCIAKGYPISAITWSHNDRELPRRSDNHLMFLNGTLKLLSLDKDTSPGRYRCKATNKKGSDQSEMFLNIAVPPSIAPFNWRPITTGHRAQFLCTVRTGDLPIRITWYWNGRDITNIQGVTVSKFDFSSSITFTAMRPEHRGRYTCVAENRAGSWSQSSELIVNEKPKIIKEPSDLSVLQSRSVHLPCLAEGFPTPQVTWYKEDDDGLEAAVKLGRDIKQAPNGTLTFLSITAQNDGKYVCSASNDIGTDVRKKISLEVRVPATVVDSTSSKVKQRISHGTSLYCSSVGTPPLELRWYKGTEVISTEQKHKYGISYIFSREKRPAMLNSTIFIQDLQRSDNGIYFCQTANLYGGDTKKFNLLVQEPPDPPAPPAATKTSSRWIEVRWFPGFDGNANIDNFRLELKLSSATWKEGKFYVVPGNQTSFRVEKLNPGDTYVFRVLATNKLGQSSPSVESTLNTEEEAPGAPPINISAAAIGSKQIKVEWQPPDKAKRNGILVGYYVVYYPTYVSDGMKNISVRSGPLEEYVLDNLMQFTMYTIILQAYNSAGPGPMGKPVRAKTLEGAPSAPPKHVSAACLNSVTIRVAWQPPSPDMVHGILKGYKVIYEETDTGKFSNKVLSTSTATELNHLRKFTVYKIQVLAFTGGGDGVKSPAVYERTAEDVPGPPTRFKATPASPNEVMITWEPPSEPNGIVIGYALYYRESFGRTTPQNELSLGVNKRSHLLQSLDIGKGYDIWMRAKTRMGLGSKTKIVNAKTMTQIPAKILTPTVKVKAHINADVSLPCLAVGHPKPTVSWRMGAQPVQTRHRRWVVNDGKLRLTNVQMKDNGPYNCTASNEYGTDWNIVTLIVQVSPDPPTHINAVQINITSVNVSWAPGHDGNSEIRHFYVKYKLDRSQYWYTHVVKSTQTWYAFYDVYQVMHIKIAGENKLGMGKFSNVVTVKPTKNGLQYTMVTENSEINVQRAMAGRGEEQTIWGPIIAGVVFAVVVILLLLGVASWDRNEHKMKSPKCHRLAFCSCGLDFRGRTTRATYEGPYCEPNMPWPWNVSNRSSGLIDVPDEEIEGHPHMYEGEDVFTELSFIQLTKTFEEMSSPGKSTFHDGPHNNNSNSSSTGYETSDSSVPCKLPSMSSTESNTSSEKQPYNSHTLSSHSHGERATGHPPYVMDHPCSRLSSVARSGHEGNSSYASASTEAERGTADGKSLADFTVSDPFGQDSHIDDPRTRKTVESNQRAATRRRRERKNLESNVHGKHVTTLEDLDEDGRLSDTLTNPYDPTVMTKNTALMIKDTMERRGAQSYDSISSTCSSSRGELLKAYEFGKKLKLQDYPIQTFTLESTTEGSSELDELCDFTSLPRSSNDCHLHMPIPVRPIFSHEDGSPEFCETQPLRPNDEIIGYYRDESLV